MIKVSSVVKLFLEGGNFLNNFNYRLRIFFLFKELTRYPDNVRFAFSEIVTAEFVIRSGYIVGLI